MDPETVTATLITALLVSRNLWSRQAIERSSLQVGMVEINVDLLGAAESVFGTSSSRPR